MLDSGHKVTSQTRKEMSSILSNKRKYDILLSLGRGWQNKQFTNKRTDSVFYGEPRNESLTPFVSAFSYDSIEWGITYSFSGERDNMFTDNKGKAVAYGEANMSMDRLYYILVNTFNGGEDFIQKYLNEVAPVRLEEQIKGIIEPAIALFNERVIKQEEKITKELEEARKAEEIVSIADKHITKKGMVHKSYRYEGKRVYDIIDSARERLDTFFSDIESGKLKVKGKSWTRESETVAELLRTDFVESMNTGLVPLNKKTLSEETMKLRRSLGFTGNTIFVASSSFVQSIIFKVRIKNV